MVSSEVIYPTATGVVLWGAIAYGLRVYRVSGNRAVLYLALGLAAVSIQSLLEAYINYLIDIDPVYETSAARLVHDTVRAFFIMLWVSFIQLMLLEAVGVESRWVKYGVPLTSLIAGMVFTVNLQLYAGIADITRRLFLGSMVRVIGFIVPSAILLGGYFAGILARQVGSKGALVIGIGFIVHALTLPFYSVAKAYGPIALGLWYTGGGIVPALLAVLGFALLMREARGV